MGKILSIVVPTKNRYTYLFSLIDQIKSISNSNIELLIQDNSEDNTEISKYLNENTYPFISYFWSSEKLTMSENSNMAILHSKGKYISFIGDDDIISSNLFYFVEQMDKKDIDCAIFKKAKYDWPGVQRIASKNIGLQIPYYSGRILMLNPIEEFDKVMKKGGTTLGFLPSLYQGVVKKDVLNKVYSKTGSYFPSDCPDMSIAISLPFFTKSLMYCDIPLISAGASPKSAAGLGAKHQHVGNLKDKSFLSSNIEENWDKRIPLIWSGPTIYADAVFASLKKIGKTNELEKFNYSYFYAYFNIFNHKYANLLKTTEIEMHNNKIKFIYYSSYLLLLRVYYFIYNRLIRLDPLERNRFINNIKSSYDAMLIIDDDISHIDIKESFK